MLAALMLSACRRAEALPTLQPTASPTPRSTALPPIATPVPLGSADNPLQLTFVTAASDAAAAAETLTSYLDEADNITANVQTVEVAAEALDSLCQSSRGTVSAAWVDGLTALAAEAQGCGTFALIAERMNGTRPSAVETIRVVTQQDIETLEDLSNATFCRISVTDRVTWLYASILLRANGIDPQADFDQINDVEDTDTLLTALQEQDCDAAVISDNLLADPPEDVNLLEVTLEIPYAVLVYPQSVTLTVRDVLNSGFVALAADDEQSQILETLLGTTRLRPPQEEDFQSLRDALAAAGLDLSQVGG